MLRFVVAKKIKSRFKKTIVFFINLSPTTKIVLGIIFLGFFIRFLGLYPNFINHPDEGWVQTYSAKLFYNIIVHGDFDPHTYKYGSFMFYLEAIPYFPIIFSLYFFEFLATSIFQSVGINHIGSFKDFVVNLGPNYQNLTIFWSQRAIVALFGVLSVWIIYIVALKLFNKPIALLSAAFLAVLPLHVRDSHYITTDVPSTFFVLLAVFFMIKLYETGKLKWYALSGFMIGFSTSIRYFPTAFLLYPIAVLLDRNKNKNWIIKILLGLIFIIPGLFIGVPFLFLSSDARAIFQQDLAKWVTPWYTTPITDFLSLVGAFLTSHGTKPFPSPFMLIPNSFSPYYVNFLFFKGIGPLPLIISLLGAIILLIKSPKKFLYLIIIPLFVFIYISSYLHSQYERLAIPVVPFLAIFIGVFFYYSWGFFKKYQLRLILVIILILSFIFPFSESFISSWACGGKTVYEQSQEWIQNNISGDSKIAYKTYTAFPSSKNFEHLFEIKPNENFSLEEAKSIGADYAFINKSNTLGYYAYRFDTDFFIAPKDIYQNNFVLLSLYEYKTRATLLKEISQPSMCAQDDLVFYKLPKESRASNLIKKFDSETQKNLDEWKILQYSIKSNIGLNLSNGSLVYKWQTINYTAPRIVSKKIPVSGGKTYTFSALIKSDQSLNQNERDGFLRIDFYSDENADISLPGEEVALSPRTYGKPQFRKTSVSSISPKNARFAVLSLQINATKPSGEFFFKDLEFFGQ